MQPDGGEPYADEAVPHAAKLSRQDDALRAKAPVRRLHVAIGGPRGDRTPDLLIANQALSQLS